MRVQDRAERTLPAWADWNRSAPYTVGIEEELMLLAPDWSLAQRSDEILPRLSPDLVEQLTCETHEAAIELATAPHRSAERAATEAGRLRLALASELSRCGLRAASAGLHPSAVWTETRVSRSARYQLVYESVRELARREPTFALHVHVGVADADRAIRLYNRLRAHIPLLLALSANSPFWQGRETGLASTRTPIFQAFPRVGIPRQFPSYEAYAEAVDRLLRCEAFPEPTFLWWDVRMQPRLGTVEVRVMDAQTTAARTGALAALVQVIAHLELEDGYAAPQLIGAVEVLEENRFIAARDGMDALLIDPVAECRVPARELIERLLSAGREHAQQLGCEAALDGVRELARETGATWQLGVGRRRRLDGLVESLAAAFADQPAFGS